jgi:hypothetical protein
VHETSVSPLTVLIANPQERGKWFDGSFRHRP